jgi:hypothetical protein
MSEQPLPVVAQCATCGREIRRGITAVSPWRSSSASARCTDDGPRHTPIVGTIRNVETGWWDREQENCTKFHNGNKTVEEVEDEVIVIDGVRKLDPPYVDPRKAAGFVLSTMALAMVVVTLFLVFMGTYLVMLPNPLYRFPGVALLIVAGTVLPELWEEFDGD